MSEPRRVSEKVSLGNSAVDASRLGLGTAPLGGLYESVAEEEAEALVGRSLELGVSFLDTAPLYGFGVAERLLSKGLAGRARDSYVLATKVGRLLEPDAPVDERLIHDGKPFFPDAPALNPVADFSHDAIMRSLEESLDRLGVDRIDVVHIHDPDDYVEQALAEAYPTLERLRAEGTIGAIGVGTANTEILAQMARAAEFDCFLLPGRYSLLDHSSLDVLLPICEQEGVSVIVGGVYNSGILAAPVAGATFEYVPAPPETLDRARRLAAVCDRHDVPLMAAAIQFPLGHPAVSHVLTGSRSVAEMEENVRMFELPIPAELWEELRAEQLLAPEVPVPTGSV